MPSCFLFLHKEITACAEPLAAAKADVNKNILPLYKRVRTFYIFTLPLKLRSINWKPVPGKFPSPVQLH